MLSWFVLCFVTLALVAHVLIKKKYNYWIKRGIPFVRPTFPLGNLRGIGVQKHLAILLEDSYNDLKGKDIFGGLFFLTKPVIILLDLDLILKILNKDSQYFQGQDYPLIPNFSFNYLRYDDLRSKLTTNLVSERIRMLYPIFLSRSLKLDKHLENKLGLKEQEITELMFRFAIDVMVSSLVGTKLSNLKNSMSKLRNSTKERLLLTDFKNETIKNCFKDIFPKLSRSVGVLENRRKDTHRIFIKIVKDSLTQKKKTNNKDILTLLIELTSDKLLGDKGSISFQDVADVTYNLYITGLQTITSTMTFALYELAHNQVIQDKARKEIRGILKVQKELSFEACTSATYMDLIIKETLRKYPTVHFLQKQLSHDYPVSDSLHMMKKGLWTVVPIYAIHRDPSIYPNPEKFNPDRFIDLEMNKRHPYSWLPFGDRALSSLENQIALTQVKVGLATILNKYKVFPNSKAPNTMVYEPSSSMLTPKGGLWLKIVKY